MDKRSFNVAIEGQSLYQLSQQLMYVLYVTYYNKIGSTIETLRAELTSANLYMNRKKSFAGSTNVKLTLRLTRNLGGVGRIFV